MIVFIKTNGLFSVKLGEIVYVIKLDKKSVEFKKMYGLVFNLTKNEVGIMFFGTNKSIAVVQSIYRSRKRLQVPVGPNLLGRIIYKFRYSFRW